MSKTKRKKKIRKKKVKMKSKKKNIFIKIAKKKLFRYKNEMCSKKILSFILKIQFIIKHFISQRNILQHEPRKMIKKMKKIA